MRSALLCVLFAIITKTPGTLAQDGDFRPTPIPLNYWSFEERDGRASYSQEITEPPAKSPAHYWEDALRHSVYLTLVRDKIDQLIAKGDVISPQSKPGLMKEQDDLDLWDKIKSAPFERLGSNELDSFGDVTVMSKGRLMDDGKGFKFTEDERSKEKCGNATCNDGVKAYWSVKRVKQRDGEPSQGRYHYELTFSVITQSPKHQRKPYENPTRTFTVRESSPETIVDRPLEKRHYEPQTQAPRAERALWIHKNLPTHRHQARQFQNGLDRIFGSLFSDDDDYEVIRYKTVPAQTPATHPQYSKIGHVGASSEQNQQHKKLVPYPYKPHTIKYARPPIPQPTQPHPHYLDMDSIGVVSAPYEPQYQENKYVLPSNQAQKYVPQGSQENRYVQSAYQEHKYVPQGVQEHKYVQPGNQEHKYVQPGNFEHKYVQSGNQDNKYLQPGSQEHQYLTPGNQDHKFHQPIGQELKYIVGKPYKLVRPPILPTPLPPLPQQSEILLENSTSEETNTKTETTPVPTPSFQTNTTRAPEQTTSHSKQRPSPVKVNYFPEHVRPPVYNAPPGVFVTMDKKPFKPMPPLRYHSTKPIKVHKPIDFRPSPQVLDVQFSDPDPILDGAFRPITIKYDNETVTTEKVEVIESTKPVEKVIRKATSTTNKPIHKKHENKKSFTTAPTLDIITAQISPEQDSDLHWTNLLGAFSKTTPMGAQKGKNETETTTPVTTSTTVKATSKRTTTTTEKAIEETTTTTQAPKKRTRPPPKFTKPEKVKKHKRGSSTTTQVPEKQKYKKQPSDLTPQASSAAAGKLTTKWTPSSTHQPSSSSVPTTTTTREPSTTTTRQSTTEAQKITSTTVETYTATERPKSENRYRQSTLMHKGTSVKHDKWSGNAADSNFKRPTSSGIALPRRKGSNFQGYVTSSTARPTDEEYYEDDIPSSSATPKISTTEALVTKVEHQDVSSGTKTTQSNYEDTVDQYEAVSEAQTAADSSEEDEEENHKEDENTDEQDTKDHTEFMFYPKSTTPNDRTNEIDEPLTTAQTVVTSPHSVAKNKTKCKKKKKPTTTEAYEFEEEDDNETSEQAAAVTTTEAAVTPDIFDDLFGGFTFDAEDSPKEEKKTTPRPVSDQEEEQSENHEKYVKLVDEDFEDFLDELDKEEGNAKNEDSFYNEDEKEESEESFEEDDGEVDDDDGQENEKTEQARGAHDYDDIEHSPYSLFELMAME